ncbi:MAG: drug/metabolite transporter (DMT)-like permease [Pseudomonadales bacterium]|jgi:drug/metabolite transporter (DMT)-like permease
MPTTLSRFIPIVFVLLWSTGFIMARFGMETAEPASFLSIRFALAAIALLIITLVFPSLRTMQPKWKQVGHAAVAGILLQAVYLGGVFAGVNQGIGAGLSSLIVGIQPVLTVLLAAVWLSEKLTWEKITGIALGFLGVALVTAEWGHVDGAISLNGIGFCIAALIGITLGTLYQKRFCQTLDLHINMMSQYVASTLFLLPFALTWESYSIDWTPKLLAVLVWLVFVLSIGAVFLLMWLIKVGEAGRVSTLFFLVPPVVAIEAWILFDEPLTWKVIAGTLLCIVGVAIVSGALTKLKTSVKEKKIL